MTAGYWYSSMVTMLGDVVIARIWSYGSGATTRRCRSKQYQPHGCRCMWEAGHPFARHMTFLSDEAWPGGPPQSVEWGRNPNPRGTVKPTPRETP